MVKLKEAFIYELVKKQGNGEITFSRMCEIINESLNNGIAESYEKEYYKIVEKHKEYKGERYFKFNPYKEHILQVCVSSGKNKKGKSNTVGIYEIARTTFISNYLNLFVEKTTKDDFDNNLNDLYNKLIKE